MTKYYSEWQVARLLGVSPKTLWNRQSAGADMPPATQVKSLRKRVYAEEPLKVWMRANRPKQFEKHFYKEVIR